MFALVALVLHSLGFAVAERCCAQNYDAPAGYYDSATGTGSVLADQLHDIIDDHTRRSYDAARSDLQVTDADPDQPGSIILVYSNESLDLGPLQGNSIPGWDSGRSWNREHSWPRSRDVGSSGDDNSDLHHLRPSDPGVNGSRSNLNFGGAFGLGAAGRVNDVNGQVWYPGDWDAGHIARQQFYMDVRYDGSDSSTTDLVLATGNPASSTGQLGDLNRLVEWHFAAPVDEFERRRNQIIFDDYQFNRNPFIDRPELAWSVFVDQQNDSRIEIAGGSSDGAGGSSIDLSLGRVIAGASATAIDQTTEVTLNKLGLDGTYYSVTAGGAATSSIEGRFNAFRSGQTDSQSLTLGLTGSTATPQQIAGTVTIDNLDITDAGGVGRGSNDGDDTINLSLTALAHAQASLAADSVVSSLMIDLGDFFAGSQFTPSVDVNISNLESSFGANLTAALDLDAILETDADDRFSFSEVLFDNLAAGEQGSLAFAGLSDQLGQFSASYELQLSDEDIVGAQSSTLSLDLSFDVVAELGDFSISGTIDDEDIDFYIGQLDVEVTSASPFPLRELDLDGDGTITLDDHELHVTTLVTTDLGKGAAIGDVNFDGIVDVLGDGATLVLNLGQSGVGYRDGDLNADGVVDTLGDGTLLILNLGQSSAAVTVASRAIPEPNGLLLITSMVAFVTARRRRSVR